MTDPLLAVLTRIAEGQERLIAVVEQLLAANAEPEPDEAEGKDAGVCVDTLTGRVRVD